MNDEGRVDADVDRLFSALQDALSVTPSPEFVPRIRARVREGPAAPAPGWWGKAAAVAALVLMAALAATLWNSGHAPGRAPVIDARSVAAPREAPLPSSAPGAASTHPSAQERRPPQRSAVIHQIVPTLHGVRTGESEGTPQALVPDDERRALDRLLLAMRRGRATVPPTRRVLEDENGQMLEPAPVDIPLLKPIEPLPDMAAIRPGSKDK